MAQPRALLAQAPRAPTTTSLLHQDLLRGTTTGLTTATAVVAVGAAMAEAEGTTAGPHQAHITTHDMMAVAATVQGMTRGMITDTMIAMASGHLHQRVTARARRRKAIMDDHLLRSSRGRHRHLRRRGMLMTARRCGDSLAPWTKIVCHDLSFCASGAELMVVL